MHAMDITNHILTKFNKTIILTVAAALIAGGFFVPKAFGAGGGDPCADGIPDARISVAPGTKAIGSLDVTLDGSNSIACSSPIVDYSWDFGDGLGADGMVVNHSYGVGVFRPLLTITDAEGLTNTYPYYTDITVKAGNQNPVITNTSAEVIQGGELQINMAASTFDPDGDDITSGYFLPADTQYGYSHSTEKGWVSFSQNGQLRYYPQNNTSGTDSVEVGVRDGFGGEARATVAINIAEYVTAVDDSTQTVENTPTTINVMANDYSYNNLPFGVYWYWGSSDGRVVRNSDNSFTFTPNPGFVGAASFEYGISDSPGSVSSHISQAFVYIEVTKAPEPPFNNPPIATNDNALTKEDEPVTITVLNNDQDIEDGKNLTVSMSSGPTHGTIVKNSNNTFSYIPWANYNGTDQFTYMVTDSGGKTSVATVSIAIEAVNDLPIAAFAYTVNKGGNVNFDGSRSTDIDGQVVSYVWDFGDGTNGTGQTTNHKYKVIKNTSYQVKLTATDNNGSSSTFTTTVNY